MTKVTDALTTAGDRPVFICDFSPPRGVDREILNDAALLDAGFICVAYNPGKAVRIDSLSLAYEIKRITGREAIFNLSPRDMNKLALESRLLGADLLGVENVVVIQGDPITERDNLKAVDEYKATGLIGAIKEMNEGLDFKGLKLRAATNLCIGASIDLGRGVEHEARLTHRKIQAGAQFFIAQPIFDPVLVTDFHAAYEVVAGERLAQPVFWGLQILVSGGVLFSNVPEDLRRDLENGRDGVDIALEIYALFQEAGLRSIYLVSPILRGGARDYAAAARFLSAVAALDA
jgi:5,10-methylenetetrahydrofolate reductase